MSTDRLGYKEYKCRRCGWVHAAITREAMAERTDLAERYLRCFKCGAPSNTFVPAAPGDAPLGSTIQGVYVPGAWDDFFSDGPAVSDDFGDGIK